MILRIIYFVLGAVTGSITSLVMIALCKASSDMHDLEDNWKGGDSDDQD